MLVIEAIAVRGQPVAEPLRATFDENGGTIGRGSASTLILPDPDRHISRTQATIGFQAGAFVITDTGTLNPLTVNGRALGGGVHARLKDGDELTVGPYRLRVHVDGMPQRTPSGTMPPAEPRSAGGTIPPAAHAVDGGIKDDPLAIFGAAPSSGASSDPFADLIPSAPPPQIQSPPTKPLPPPSAAPAGGAGMIPADFDPFGTAPEPVRDPLAGQPVPDRNLQPLPPSEDIDELFKLPDARVEPRLTDNWILNGAGAPSTSNEPDPLGLYRYVGNDKGGSAPDHVPEIHQHYKPPPPLAPEPPPAPPRKMSSQDVPAGDGPDATLYVKHEPAQQAAMPAATPSELSVQLAEAFLRGAGVRDVKFPNGMTPELAEIIGRIMRESVQGTLDLLSARSQVKVEIHSSATVIVPRDNNPLKFSPNVEVALSHLLEPKGHGFMTPIRAMRDAYDDLRAHQIAVLAGMRAALTGVLLRFKPERLETKLKQRSVLDNLLPINRKAKQWDLFTELFREISAEAEEDYRVVFGKEFRRAYEAQLAKLRSNDPNAPRR
jgi:FHA domain-containing protein